MAKKTKTYPLYIALLLCFFQVAGIDVYAQEPVKVSQDSISPVREAPKARARRHREPGRFYSGHRQRKSGESSRPPTDRQFGEPETRYRYGRQPGGSQPTEPGKDRNTRHAIGRKGR